MSIRNFIKKTIKILDEPDEYDEKCINNDLIQIVECGNDRIKVIDKNKKEH